MWLANGFITLFFLLRMFSHSLSHTAAFYPIYHPQLQDLLAAQSQHHRPSSCLHYRILAPLPSFLITVMQKTSFGYLTPWLSLSLSLFARFLTESQVPLASCCFCFSRYFFSTKMKHNNLVVKESISFTSSRKEFF